MGFPTNYKSVYSIKFSLPNMRLKDMLTVITSELLLLCTVAVRIERDNTLTCTDDLNRLTNAHE